MSERRTVKQTIDAVRALGLTCTRTSFGEYRINFPAPRGDEATAYYTEDADDAIGTAMSMAQAGEAS